MNRHRAIAGLILALLGGAVSYRLGATPTPDRTRSVVRPATVPTSTVAPSTPSREFQEPVHMPLPGSTSAPAAREGRLAAISILDVDALTEGELHTLAGWLEDEDEDVRLATITALSWSRRAECRDLLLRRYQAEPSSRVRWHIVERLSGHESALASLLGRHAEMDVEIEQRIEELRGRCP